MKNIPIAYQTFIYIIGLVLALFLLIYAASQSIIPSVYIRQSQEIMNQRFEELNDELIQAFDFDSLQNKYNEYKLRSPYDIQVYNLKGEALFENISRLSPSILINLNEGYIDDLYYDGYVSFLVRIERFDEYIYKTEVPLDGLYQTISTTNDVLLIVFILSFILAIFFSFLISKITTNPIKKLKIMSESYNNKLELNRKDEIGQLSKAIDRLRRNLKSTITKLEQELEREKKQDKLVKLFIANVSHEFQTPLAIMLGAIETLADNKNLSIDHKNKYFDMINLEIKRLENLTKDILKLSKIQITDEQMDHFKINDFFEEIVDNIKLIHKNEKIILDLEKSNPYILFNRNRFEQVLINILTNSIKHKKKGKIAIKSFKNDSKIQIEVSNEVDNLFEKDLPHLFDAFYKKSSNGNGLGLAIVKSILEKQKVKFGFRLEKNILIFYMDLEVKN